ncbi:MAG: hypothetical protein LBG62_03395 [Candidatus Methanoplasma sp.]|jgi:hypothetical protein|nr:hypothetical protein [Candidatus Methanoplasma sp.]
MKTKTMGRDRAGFSTVMAAVVLIIIVAAAGAAAYVALGGGGGGEDGGEKEASGMGAGSTFAYAAGGSSIGTEILGVSADKYTIRFTSGAIKDATFAVKRADGGVSAGGEDAAPLTQTGAGDGRVSVYRISYNGAEADVAVKKINGEYNVSEVKIGSTAYVLDESKSVVKPVAALPSNVGSRLEYSFSSSVKISGFDIPMDMETTGSIVVECDGATADGRFVYSVKTTVSVAGMGSESGFVFVISDDAGAGTVLAGQEDTPFSSVAPTVKRGQTLKGTIDGDVTVDVYEYALTAENIAEMAGLEGLGSAATGFAYRVYMGDGFMYKASCDVNMEIEGILLEMSSDTVLTGR